MRAGQQLLVVFFSGVVALNAMGAEAFRILPIPKSENGYDSFASGQFESHEQLDAFLKTLAGKPGWNERKRFEDALKNAKIDFKTERLVLLRHTEGSGSIDVQFLRPEMKGAELRCGIARKEPGGAGTTDMAYYCFALVLQRDAVKKLEFKRHRGGESFDF